MSSLKSNIYIHSGEKAKYFVLKKRENVEHPIGKCDYCGTVYKIEVGAKVNYVYHDIEFVPDEFIAVKVLREENIITIRSSL